ncbi:hypothetical protein DACRYDRAFT_20629 [Dacryopinax primogenitus]|uniref:DUF6533 domain-containing protein n=1 Tax=Dacryopinax primogenitus (strain DJM 731) TaxID=1858805 RepID=M5GG92_DACPD|nr:uncharacterized protein DACRYDRAFT_20629 [Dacryopinax primogenitus]EJU05083.1 hypothetical protein DACRYDRAFT_20629 [Dacryopinax primogenitus]
MDSSIVTELSQARATQYSMAASAALAFYDIILTIPQESKLIWGAPRSVVKYLYLFNRYCLLGLVLPQTYIMGGFSGPLSDHVCKTYWVSVTWVLIVQTPMIGSFLVLLRVYALYKTVKHIKLFLALLSTLAWLSPTVILSYALATFWNGPDNFVYTPVPGLCAITSRPPYFWAYWPGLMVFQFAVCGILIAETIRNRNQRRMMNNGGVISYLLRDGIFYNLCMLAGHLANLPAYVALPDSLFLVAYAPDWTLDSLLISKIYLNLRHVATASDWAVATSLYVEDQQPEVSWESD